MSLQMLIVILSVLLVGAVAALIILTRRGSQNKDILGERELDNDERVTGDDEREDDSLTHMLGAAEGEDSIGSTKKIMGAPTIQEQLIMAGRLSPQDRADFTRKRILAPIVCGGSGLIVGILVGDEVVLVLTGLFGLLIGLWLPLRILSGWVVQQHEEISYYLPLVIEQMAIGVSSSLDIGPCISQIVTMADERSRHNAVTKLLKYAQYQIRSGVSFEEALIDIGTASGHQELKHTCKALSQVAKFGGEITKQLQDLADTVAGIRESRIEEKIRSLEVKATGPVALVFVGYISTLVAGILSLFVETSMFS